MSLNSIRAWAVWLVFLCATTFVVHHWFFPIRPFYYGDDWFVLPERLWFKNPLAWLGHLLFFNQTRFTYVGDYMLYRPGVFLWIWLQDIFLRDDRVGLQWLMVGAATLVSLSQFAWLRRSCGALLAASAALYALASPAGNLLFAWPHISGYIFALGLYTLGTNIWLAEDFSPKRAWQSGAVFFMAECFHEFVAISLLLILALELATSRRWHRRLNAVVVPLGAYLAMVLTVRAITSPPSFFSPDELNKIYFGLPYLMTVAERQWQIVSKIFSQAIPLAEVSGGLEVLRLTIGGALLAAALWIAVNRVRGTARRRLNLALVPVVALLVGLGASRVAMRGGIGNYYHEMFHYFVIMAGVLVWSAAVPARSGWTHFLCVLLMASAVYTAQQVGEENAAMGPTSGFLIKTVGEVRAFLSQHPDRCYGGVFAPSFPSFVNQNVNIPLQTYTCGWREGSPFYLLPSLSEAAQELTLPPDDSAAGRIGLARDLGSETASDDLGEYLRTYPYNYREAGHDIHHSGLIRIRWTGEATARRELRARFHSDDDFPQFNNSGLSIRRGTRSDFVMLQDNNLVILRKDGPGVAQVIAQTQLAEIRSDFTLRIADLQGHCAVFADEVLLTQVADCLAGPSQVGIFTFENGTAAETASEFTYRKN